MSGEWSFPDDESTEVITLERILRGVSPVRLVCHDLDDPGWQFLDGEHVFEEDGAVVYLGDMVQLDPSLADLADLPAGWHAWRAAPGLPWQCAEGEPVSLPEVPPQEHAPIGGRNIEIKARVADLDQVRAAAEEVSDTPVEAIDQEDIFFEVPDGRLKLRIFGPDSGELIQYHREDRADPKASHYLIAPTNAPTALQAILNRILPKAGIVRKRRWLYRVGQTRVHLDQVEGLGDFLELEVVLRPGQSEADGIAIAEALMERLGVSPDQLVPQAYVDLLRS